MAKIKKLISREEVQSALICFFIGLLSIGFFVLKNGGLFSLRADFNMQQIPFTAALHNSILDGGPGGWSWNVDLGTSTIQAFGFYEMGSPFFWITMLFPTKYIPYLIGWIYILKYVVAGITSCLYFKRFLKNTGWAVWGSVLYAFSGFSTTNLLFYHFHDVVAFFPLMLLGLELLIEEDNKWLFTISVALNCLINYYFFITEAIFLVVYFLFRFWNRNYKTMLINIVKCLLFAVLGIGMACVLFLPSIMYVLGMVRASSKLSSLGVIRDLRSMLNVIKGLLLPGESMSTSSSIIAGDFTSTNANLPMIGLTCVIAYLIKNRNWLSRLLIFLFICSVSPILTSAFLLFSDSMMRWWFCLVIMMSLASCMVMDEIERYNLILPCCLSGGLLIAFFVITEILNNVKGENSWIYDHKMFINLVLVALLGLVVFVVICRNKNALFQKMIISVSIFAVIITAYAIHVYKAGKETSAEYYDKFMAGINLPVENEQYRYNCADNIMILPSDGAGGFIEFTSTDANSIDSLESIFGYYCSNWAIDKSGTYEGLAALLGGKYRIETEPQEGYIDSYTSGDVTYYIYEDPACPIGYAVDSFFTRGELQSDIEDVKRAIPLMRAVSIEDADVELASTLMRPISVHQINLDTPIETLAEANTINAVTDFERDGHGFRCRCNYNKSECIFFTVPYDEGWRAFVDGVNVPIIYSSGMMLIPISPGEHSIEFIYRTPGYKEGAIISAVSFLIFASIIGVDILRKRKVRKDNL